MNKKKPIFTLKDCHKPNTWMLSTASVKSSDLLASGGYDGCINFYQFNKAKKEIIKTNSLSGFTGCINCLKFSHTRGAQTYQSNQIMLAASHSQEEKWGRWHV